MTDIITFYIDTGTWLVPLAFSVLAAAVTNFIIYKYDFELLNEVIANILCVVACFAIWVIYFLF